MQNLIINFGKVNTISGMNSWSLLDSICIEDAEPTLHGCSQQQQQLVVSADLCSVQHGQHEYKK